jgi:hypothetical protein
MNILVTGTTGFIGKKLLYFIKKTFSQSTIIEITRKNIDNLENILQKIKINIFIHIIHDFKNPKNNIDFIMNFDMIFKQNYYPEKFIYFSSWVTVFNMGIKDQYYLSKLQCENYIIENIKNYIILRPSLVCGFNNVWTKKIILYCSYGYYIHLNELCSYIIDYILYLEPYKIVNMPSHFYNLNIFNKIFKNINFSKIFQNTFNFITHDIKFSTSHEDISYECLLYQKIKTLNDVKWFIKYFKYEDYDLFVNAYSFNISHQKLKPIQIDMSNYNSILEYNDKTITVESGITLEKMLLYLNKYNKTIEHIPFFCGMSVSSCLCTDVHGMSTISSCTASCIVEFTVINKKSNKIITHDILNKNNIDFKENIIIKIKFNIIDKQNILIETLLIDDNILCIPEKKIIELFNNNYAFCINWHKSNNKTYLTTYNLTKKNVNNINLLPVRRHVPFINVHYKKYKILSYNDALNEYKWLFGECYLFKNFFHTSVCGIEIYCSLIYYNDYSNIINDFIIKKKISSILLRFTKSDSIINFLDSNIICWFEILTNKESALELLNIIKKNKNKYYLHRGKYK